MSIRKIRTISFSMVFLALLILAPSCSVAHSETAGDSLSPREAYELITGANPPLLVDVRTQAEFEAGHLKNALNVPLDEFINGTYAKKIGDPAKDKPIIVFCRSGHRSGIARSVLIKDSYTNVKNVEGGIIAWKQADLPIVIE